MIDPQDACPDLALDGEIDDLAAGPGDGPGQAATSACGEVIAQRSAQRTRRMGSADLRSTSVCW